eukprot:293835-Pleurochrysis_carterae.AAC.1
MDRDNSATAAQVPVGVPVVPGEHGPSTVRGVPMGSPLPGNEASPQTLPREQEQLVAAVRAAADEEIQRMQTALRAAGNNQLRHAEESMRSTARHQQEAFACTIETAAWQAQQRVISSVHKSIEAQLEPALQKFLANTPRTTNLVNAMLPITITLVALLGWIIRIQDAAGRTWWFQVDRVATSLERQVEERAASVVRRLAAEEAMTHALSRELEAKVDSRMLSFWTGWLCSTATLAVASFAWHWYDANHRRS